MYYCITAAGDRFRCQLPDTITMEQVHEAAKQHFRGLINITIHPITANDYQRGGNFRGGLTTPLGRLIRNPIEKPTTPTLKVRRR